jgi:hypothetical protein
MTGEDKRVEKSDRADEVLCVRNAIEAAVDVAFRRRSYVLDAVPTTTIITHAIRRIKR